MSVAESGRFRKVDTQVDFPAQESAILAYWEEIGAFGQLVRQNAGKPRWSFLDGPITANNPMGVHHAWGRTYKDAYQRYFAMTGHELRYQNGFDCQGLWVEVEVEKELKLGSKRDIESLVPGDRFASIDRFVGLCKERVDRFARVQTEQSVRLGYWMNWDRTDADWARPAGERKSYFTMSDENNYTIWAFLKKCHDRGSVYKAYDAMPWCPRCGAGISQQEMNEGYKVVAHRAIFVKFPLRDRPGEALLAWTTTPWTLTSNVAAAVNPELTYLRVRHGDTVYYVGKGAFRTGRLEDQFKNKEEWVEGVPKLKSLEQMFKEKSKEGFEILGELKGSEMVGWAYDGPFDEMPAQHAPYGYPAEVARVAQARGWCRAVSGAQVHRVVAWKEVGETEGTGIVHIAPGCGKEDFALGREQGLPPVAPLDESGIFLEGFGDLAGKSGIDPAVVEYVVASLQAKNRLFATERYPHKYPHCWRCKTELLYRLVDEWFIRMDWRDEIKKVVEGITWLPEEINGKSRELDWLTNMGDWMVSKKRYWGLALPIWVDEETHDFEVLGSFEELKERAVAGWDEFVGHTPHRPWIDKVKIRNPRSGNLMSRIPDVGNPWLDAGIVPYSTMGYSSDRGEWDKWFPADFVVESFPGQFRNWFYSMLALSTMMENRAPFETLLGHGLVRDQSGEDMHKSKGNSIPFDGAAGEGFKLFVERNPKQKPEDQAKKQLPAGYLKLDEGEEFRDGKPFQALRAYYEPIGADVIRWLYCRSNPAQNINFGPGPADEVRSRFVLKLWNTYAFFVNYARIDDFNPSAPPVPVGDRPNIDRWILSDLQLLVRQAHESFLGFRVMEFCLGVERFIDDKLSNWYVRSNRRRFWKSEAGRDKLAAYQTLYQVLVTVTKLVAPVVPFLAESIYQNLKASGSVAGDAASVHLTEYPVADEALIDEALSDETGALLRLVSLGHAARKASKIKVRQPLGEMRIQPGDETERRAVERFGEQLCDELNLKTVTLHDESHGLMLSPTLKLNVKVVAPRLGAKLKGVQAELASRNPLEALRELNEQGTLTLDEEPLTQSELVVDHTAPEGFTGVADRSTMVMLDTRVTEDLALEGLARDVVRLVQEQRKKSQLEMEDRITLSLDTASDKLREAIARHRDYIATETLTVEWPTSPRGEAVPGDIDGQKLLIALAKV